jgi:hypothetical protein
VSVRVPATVLEQASTAHAVSCTCGLSWEAESFAERNMTVGTLEPSCERHSTSTAYRATCVEREAGADGGPRRCESPPRVRGRRDMRRREGQGQAQGEGQGWGWVGGRRNVRRRVRVRVRVRVRAGVRLEAGATCVGGVVKVEAVDVDVAAEAAVPTVEGIGEAGGACAGDDDEEAADHHQ